MRRLKALFSLETLGTLSLLVLLIVNFHAVYDAYAGLPATEKRIADAQERLNDAASGGDAAGAVAAQDALSQARDTRKGQRRNIVLCSIVGTLSLIGFCLIAEPWRHIPRRKPQPIDPSA